jgi:hypothetical protein
MRRKDDRDSVIKDDLLLLTRSGIAWEALRRNLAYLDVATRTDAKRTPLRPRPPLTTIEAPVSEEAEQWGLLFAEHDKRYQRAAVFWSPEADPSVLPVVVEPADGVRNDRAEYIDFRKLSIAVTVLRRPNRPEAVLLCDGIHAIQLHILEGTVLNGPVFLNYQLRGFRWLKERALTLQRLEGFQRHGRFLTKDFQPLGDARRFLMALVAVDMQRSGKFYRDIAREFLGEQAYREWNGRTDKHRSYVGRKLQLGQRLIEGDYRKILCPEGVWENLSRAI